MHGDLAGIEGARTQRAEGRTGAISGRRTGENGAAQPASEISVVFGVLVMLTWASGTAALLGSSTAPVTVPERICANATAAESERKSTASFNMEPTS